MIMINFSLYVKHEAFTIVKLRGSHIYDLLIDIYASNYANHRSDHLAQLDMYLSEIH